MMTCRIQPWEKARFDMDYFSVVATTDGLDLDG